MKSIALCALLTPVVAGGGLAMWPHAPSSSMSMTSPSMKQAAVVALAVASTNSHSEAPKLGITPATDSRGVDLHAAVQQQKITAEFKGNGRDKVRAILTNKTSEALVIRVSAGQMFEAGSSMVIVTRAGEVDLRPNKPVEVSLQTAATRSGNKVAEMPYELSFGTLPRVQTLLAYAQERPELTAGALQTAILALVENLPLSSVAKFNAAGGDLPSKFDSTNFKADTTDILHALLALRAIGARENDLAMTIDQQLKIEAMIEPATRSAAMRYYGITPETEWAYWKNELLSGEPTTRHYALYGIARFYPEVALEMLPKWARETKTGTVFRVSAVQALADTQRPEALPLLQQLSDEFGAQTELGRTASGAAKLLSAQLAKIAAGKNTVAFRGSPAIAQF